MAEIPRRFVAPDSECSLDLISRHPLACFHEQQNGHEPSFQGQVRIVKDRLRGHAKLIAAFAAFKLAIVGKLENLFALAAEAFNTVGPAQFLEQSAALFISRKHLSEVFESHG